jgi:hypothetical protein
MQSQMPKCSFEGKSYLTKEKSHIFLIKWQTHNIKWLSFTVKFF